MKHPIDPKIDCVFKALLGTEENSNLLIHFLNAILGKELDSPITGVEILNPYNDKETLNDKLSIVDIKAKDAWEQIFQVEIQLLNYHNIPARIAYTWADMYTEQLKDGKDYLLLKPTYSIWLLDSNFNKDANYRHIYKLRDEQGEELPKNGGIWTFELKKFKTLSIENDEERWLQFFQQGEHLDDSHLPEWMQTPEMEQAMTTLRRFSEKETHYHDYQARQNFLRQQRTIQGELDAEREARSREQQERVQIIKTLDAVMLREKTERLAKETALQREEAERLAKETALQREEAERLAKETALQREEAERLAKETALQREAAALAEIERLKAQLNQAQK